MAKKQQKKLRFDFDGIFEDTAAERRRVWRKHLWRDLRRQKHEGSFDELRQRPRSDDEPADDG